MDSPDKIFNKAEKALLNALGTPNLIKTRLTIQSALHGNLIAENLAVLGEVLVETVMENPSLATYETVCTQADTLLVQLSKEHRPDQIVAILGTVLVQLGMAALLSKTISEEAGRTIPELPSKIPTNPENQSRLDLN